MNNPSSIVKPKSKVPTSKPKGLGLTLKSHDHIHFTGYVVGQLAYADHVTTILVCICLLLLLFVIIYLAASSSPMSPWSVSPSSLRSPHPDSSLCAALTAWGVNVTLLSCHIEILRYWHHTFMLSLNINGWVCLSGCWASGQVKLLATSDPA